MKKIKGNSVSNGVAIGKAKIIKKHELQIERKTIHRNEVKIELNRFNEDVNFVINELNKLIQDYTYSQENRDILAMNLALYLSDELTSQYLECKEPLRLKYEAIFLCS